MLADEQCVGFLGNFVQNEACTRQSDNKASMTTINCCPRSANDTKSQHSSQESQENLAVGSTSSSNTFSSHNWAQKWVLQPVYPVVGVGMDEAQQPSLGQEPAAKTKKTAKGKGDVAWAMQLILSVSRPRGS